MHPASDPPSPVSDAIVDESRWPLIRRIVAIAYFVGIALIIAFVGCPPTGGSLAAAILPNQPIPLRFSPDFGFLGTVHVWITG